MDSQRPSRVCTLLATATWVCRSGSPARLSRWVNAAATRPRTLTCRIPCGPVRVNRGVLLDECQRVLDSGLMGAFDHSWHRRIGHGPQRGHRFHRGEGQVVTRNRLCPRPRVFRDLSRQLSGINRLPAMLGQEEVAGHLGPHPRPISNRQRRGGRQGGRSVDPGNAPGDLEPEWADIAIDNPERSSKTGRVLIVARGEVWPFQLLLAELGQWMQTAAEQCTHQLGGHRVADGQAVDPV
jgi:hypothetical protein